MTGLIVWDVTIWAILGFVAGWLVVSWFTLRAGLGVIVLTTLGALGWIVWAVLLGVEGGPMVATAEALLFSLPATTGLAIGSLAAHLVYGRRT